MSSLRTQGVLNRISSVTFFLYSQQIVSETSELNALKETVLREFEGQVVVHYDDLAPIEWVSLLNIRREIKEKQYKSIQDIQNKANKQEAGEKEATKQTSLATHRMDAINAMMKNSTTG